MRFFFGTIGMIFVTVVSMSGFLFYTLQVSSSFSLLAFLGFVSIPHSTTFIHSDTVPLRG